MSIGHFTTDKFIIHTCSDLDSELKCHKQPLLLPNCKDCENCELKNILYECLGFRDDGRYEFMMSSKHLTSTGELAKKIIKMLDVELIKEKE